MIADDADLPIRAGLGRAAMLGSVCALLVACMSQDAPDDTLGRRSDELALGASPLAVLRPSGSCEDLLAYLHADLFAQLEQRAEELRRGVVAAFSEATTFSETTTQVEAVDEGDLVETDGDRLYVLHGPALYVFAAGAADPLQFLGAAPIEGEVVELLVRDGKAVVFSRIYGDIVPGPSDPDYLPLYTKLTVFDVAAGAPHVVRESYVEGDPIATRRNHGVVRALLRSEIKYRLDSPTVFYTDPFGNPYSQSQVDQQVDLWVALSSAAIQGSSLEDYLPEHFETVDGTPELQPPRCEDYLLPAPVSPGAGVSTLLSLDLDAVDEPLRSVQLLGNGELLHVSEDAALLTQRDDRAPSSTLIHRFELDGALTRYSASGSVAGSIQLPSSLDERDGVVRVATLEQGALSRIVTLAPRGERLVEIGRTPDLAPGAAVHATRFLGDRGYVASFDERGSLSIIDLAESSAPTIAGALELSGVSQILYPLLDRHLLALGSEVDSGVWRPGMALQVLDVRDPAAPRIVDRYVIEGGSSEAMINHRALSFHPERDLVAFPYQDLGAGRLTLELLRVSTSEGIQRIGAVVSPAAPERTLPQCLRIMDYPSDPEFLEELELDPDWKESILRYCQGLPEWFRRGALRGDHVYAITSDRVAAYGLDALDGSPVREVVLPSLYEGGGIAASVEGPPAD